METFAEKVRYGSGPRFDPLMEEKGGRISGDAPKYDVEMFSVMAASWFCEMSGYIGKVEDVKPVLIIKETDFNRQPC